MKDSIERKMGTCKHFTGVQNDTCSAGLDYDEVVDRSVRPYRWPCLSGGTGCDRAKLPTREEAEEDDKKQIESIRNFLTAREAICKAAGNKRGLRDSIDCPICESGRLSYSIAALNGHIHAKCSTDGCVQWME